MCGSWSEAVPVGAVINDWRDRQLFRTLPAKLSDDDRAGGLAGGEARSDGWSRRGRGGCEAPKDRAGWRLILNNRSGGNLERESGCEGIGSDGGSVFGDNSARSLAIVAGRAVSLRH